MMKYEELTELINHLDQSSLAFMDYQTDDEHIILSKEVPQMAHPKIKDRHRMNARRK